MQGIAVSVIVAVAAIYAAWRLMPPTLRRWLAGRLMAVSPSCRGWLARLVAEAENGGCNSCRSCKSCAADGGVPALQGRAKIEVHRPGRVNSRRPNVPCP